MRRLGLAIAWLLLAGPVIALTLDTLPDQQDAVMKLYVRGTQKLQDNDFVGAMEDLKRAVKARPEMAEAFHNLGFALEKTGDLKLAAKAYERAITLRPTYASAYNNLGFLLATAEVDKQRAVQLCQRAVELEPTSAPFRDSLGWTCYKAGRLDDAMLNFRAAVKLDPSFVKPYFNMGLCEFTQKNYSEAAKNFTLVLQRNSQMLKAYLPLAECYERMQQNNRAIYVYQQAMSKAPDTSPVKKHIERQIKRLTQNSKTFYFSNVKNMQGSSRLSSFIQRKGRSGSLTGNASRVTDPMETSGSFTPVSVAPQGTRTGGGELDLGEQTSSFAPGNSLSAISGRVSVRDDGEISVSSERNLEKRYNLCQSYLDKGLVQEAAAELEKIVSFSGTSSIGRQARSLLLKARKMLDERSKERAETHLSMGKDFIRSGKLDMAEVELKKALRLSPESAEGHKDLALLYYNLGKMKEAYEESKQAIALDRTMKEAYVVLASLYSKKGRKDDAMRTLRKMRELPGDRDAVDDLAERMMVSLGGNGG